MNEWHICRCRECGTQVMSRQYQGRDVLCPECALEVRRERAREQYRRANYKEPRKFRYDGYIVEYDPLPIEEGGFRKGAVLLNDYFEWSLKNFVPGMIFQRCGKRLVVKEVGREHRLVPLDN